MHVWTEPPKAYDPSVRACVRWLLGVKHVSGVDAADAAVFIIDGPLSSRLRAASDYVLTAPRFKDRVLHHRRGVNRRRRHADPAADHRCGRPQSEPRHP